MISSVDNLNTSGNSLVPTSVSNSGGHNGESLRVCVAKQYAASLPHLPIAGVKGVPRFDYIIGVVRARYPCKKL